MKKKAMRKRIAELEEEVKRLTYAVEYWRSDFEFMDKAYTRIALLFDEVGLKIPYFRPVTSERLSDLNKWLERREDKK